MDRVNKQTDRADQSDIQKEQSNKVVPSDRHSTATDRQSNRQGGRKWSDRQINVVEQQTDGVHQLNRQKEQ